MNALSEDESKTGSSALRSTTVPSTRAHTPPPASTP
jgi:hypothetical protein